MQSPENLKGNFKLYFLISSSIIKKNCFREEKFLSENITKKFDSKLEKKKAKLQKLISTKNQIEHKIKLLKADIEVLQTQQFEKLKKAAKKENLEIRSDDIPEILQLIKNLQLTSKIDSEEISETTLEDGTDQSYSENVEEKDTTTCNGMRTLQSLQTINSFRS